MLFLEKGKRGRVSGEEAAVIIQDREIVAWPKVVAVGVESCAQILDIFWRLNWQGMLMGSERKR